jgi:hypothetical protein
MGKKKADSFESPLLYVKTNKNAAIEALRQEI